MALVFETDFRNGSFLEKISGIQATNYGGYFKQTPYGLGFYSERNTYCTFPVSHLNLTSTNNVYYLVSFWTNTYNRVAGEGGHLINFNNYQARIYLTLTYIGILITGAGGSSVSAFSGSFMNKFFMIYVQIEKKDTNSVYKYTVNNVSITGTVTGYSFTAPFNTVYLGRWDVTGYGYVGNIYDFKIFDKPITNKQYLSYYKHSLSESVSNNKQIYYS